MENTIETPANTNVAQSAIISMSVKEWAIQNGYTAGISKQIALSEQNGYPFITFLHATEKVEVNGVMKTKAQTVFFSVEAAKLVDEGEVIDAELMNQFQMSYATCKAAPEGYAWKLCRKGESDKYNTNVFNVLQ